MNKINNKYYCGYEGEKEIQFIAEKEKLIIWDGFFNDIMEQFKPSTEGWMGLAYYYHMSMGWYDESPWKIPNLEECLQHFKQLDISDCRFKESEKVLLEICEFVHSAIQKHENVWIAEE